MKSIIKQKLKILVEGRKATHTPTNHRGPNVKKVTTQATYNRTLADISNAMETYLKNPEGYGGVYYGDGTYQMDLYPNGQLIGRPTAMGGKREPGTYNDPNPFKRSFFLKSCTDIQHDDQPDKSCSPVGKSPMEDAKIKVLVFFKDDILEFLKSNMEGEDMYTADDKGAEISKEKMTDKQATHKVKKDIETKLGRRLKDSEWEEFQATGKEPEHKSSGVTMDSNEAELRSQLRDVTAQKIKARQARDKEAVRRLTSLEKQLKAKLG